MVSGKEDLICPTCGNIIDKNSRNPESKAAIEETEEKIGRVYAALLHMGYIFYMVMGVIGATGFFLDVRMLLYVATGISLAVYVIQFLTGTVTFPSGVILLPAGAVACYFYFHTIEGACLGIHLVFLIRHLIRDVIFRLVLTFIRAVSGD